MTFDPGNTTGFIEYSNITHVAEIDCFYKYDGIYKKLNSVIDEERLVIIENVHGILKTREQIQMSKKVGFIEGVCEYLNISYILQVPQVRKGYLELAKKILKKNVNRFERHNVDAFAHMLRYLDKNHFLKEFLSNVKFQEVIK